MSVFNTIAQRGRALLIQAMERRWPGCGAHTKHNQINGRDELVWSGLLAPEIQRDIRSFVTGWDEGIAATVRVMQDAAPFEDMPAPAGRPNRKPAAGKLHGSRVGPVVQGATRRDDRAAAALAGLQSLFSGSEGSGS